MDGRVDPPSSLREQDREGVGRDRVAPRLRTEEHLAIRERPQHERRQEPILSQQEQVLLVQGRHLALSVLSDDVGVGDDRNPVVVVLLSTLQAVHLQIGG